MSENYLPVVAGTAVAGGHMLRLLFSDGTVGDIDFTAERWTGVLAPLNDSADHQRPSPYCDEALPSDPVS